jgi:alkaline phosphatase D
MPVRRSAGETVYRAIALGPLGDLVMLDTRATGRDRPATTRGAVWSVRGTDGSLLGADQWRWLEGEVASSRARWLLIGNQVMMAPLRLLDARGGRGFNPSQWDGYPGERHRLYDLLRRTGWASNVAVLSGDIHSSWAADLPVGAEFVSPSVTTDSFTRTVLPPVPGASAVARRWFLAQNRHIRLADLDRHGYVTVDVSEERIHGDWWHVDTIARRDRSERWGGGWTLQDGQLGLRRAAAPATTR